MGKAVTTWRRSSPKAITAWRRPSPLGDGHHHLEKAVTTWRGLSPLGEGRHHLEKGCDRGNICGGAAQRTLRRCSRRFQGLLKSLPQTGQMVSPRCQARWSDRRRGFLRTAPQPGSGQGTPVDRADRQSARRAADWGKRRRRTTEVIFTHWVGNGKSDIEMMSMSETDGGDGQVGTRNLTFI